MTDLLGPASALNAVTVRPADIRVFGPDDSWFKACENGVEGTGTIIQATFLNGILAQLRTVISEAGVAVDNADDEMLWKAIQRALNLNFTTKRLPWMAVNSMGVYEPPASPADGDTYVVPSGASGDWTGQGLRLAQWDADLAVWRFQSAPTGTVVWSADTNEAWRKTATVWVRFVSSEDFEGLYRLPSFTAETPFSAVTGDITNLGTGVAIASSDVTGYEKAKAFDDNTGTHWECTAGTPVNTEWVGWDFDPTRQAGDRITLTKGTFRQFYNSSNDNDIALEVALEYHTGDGVWTEAGRTTCTMPSANSLGPVESVTPASPIAGVAAARFRPTSTYRGTGGTVPVRCLVVAEVEFIENL